MLAHNLKLLTYYLSCLCPFTVLSLSLSLYRDSTKIKCNGLYTLFLCGHHLFSKLTHLILFVGCVYMCVVCVFSLSSPHPSPLSFLPLFFLSFILDVSNYRKLPIFAFRFQSLYPVVNLTETTLEDRFYSQQWGNVALLFINLLTDNIILMYNTKYQHLKITQKSAFHIFF